MDSVVCKLMMFSNVIVDITISRCLFVFSQSHVDIPVSLWDEGEGKESFSQLTN